MILAKTPKGFQVGIRRATEQDSDFLLNSWLTSYWDSRAPAIKQMRKRRFFERHHPIASRLVESSTVFVACAHDDEPTILGYAVYSHEDPQTLHYVYVKHIFRRHGIASELLSAAGWPSRSGDFLVTHRNLDFDRLCWNAEIFFDPYMLCEFTTNEKGRTQ